MLIQIAKRPLLAVNPADISSIFICTVVPEPYLEVQMRSGGRYRVLHEPNCPDGDDMYQVHRQLLEAK